jgi:Cu(I)/Ag(I) efflux system protein CusF
MTNDAPRYAALLSALKDKSMKTSSYVNKTIAILFAVATAIGSAAAAQPYTGEIVKVDPAAGKIMIKAGPIKKFDMDAMSMGYRVSDPLMLKNVKVGDRITFDADKIDGAFTVIKIEKAK